METDLDQNLTGLKSKLQDGKVIVGMAKVIKKIRSGAIEKVFLAKNCPKEIRNDLVHLANLSKTTVIDLQLDNEELGVFCKKNFFVSVLGITK